MLPPPASPSALICAACKLMDAPSTCTVPPTLPLPPPLPLPLALICAELSTLPFSAALCSTTVPPAPSLASARTTASAVCITLRLPFRLTLPPMLTPEASTLPV